VRVPDYKEAFSTLNALKAAIAIAELGGVANFSKIQKQSGIIDTTLVHSLNILTSSNVVEKEVKGTYRLRYRTPLCYLFSRISTPIAYLGLLGRRHGRTEPETETALDLLKAEGIKSDAVYVLTSVEALEEWKPLRLPYRWILCYEEEIIDIDSVKNKVQQELDHLLRDYVIVTDCTSATKPATIAYYELAQIYQMPLIYIYEEQRKLKWLKTKEALLTLIIPEKFRNKILK